jgi:hypothetical protein
MFISPDDKAVVKLGVIAAKKQKAMVMHMHYRLRLPSHDFVHASRHQLIPSVYSFLSIGSKIGFKNSITYPGPTAVFIRSSKHDQSTAYSHRKDLQTMLHQGHFSEFTHNDAGVKPVVILRSDNGPDEAPRNPTTQEQMAKFFLQNKLVALFLGTLPAGMSLFSPGERRMAGLSNSMTGVVLDPEHHGSHLNSSKETIDLDLEKRNFKHAGETLSSLFNGVKYGGYETQSVYVDPPEDKEEPLCPEFVENPEITAEWRSKHLRASKYLLQIIACSDSNCCSDRPAHIQNLLRPLLPHGFLPPPFKLVHAKTDENLPFNIATDKKSDRAVPFLPLAYRCLFPVDKKFPYDTFLPSLANKLPKCICDICQIQYPSHAQMIVHRRAEHKYFRGVDLDLDSITLLQNCPPIVRIIDHKSNSSQYLATFEDESTDWVSISEKNNPHVVEYFQENHVNIHQYELEKAEWMIPFSQN